MFHKNNYKPDFVKLNTYKNNELNETDNPTTVTATILYIKGTSEIISRILRPYNIRVAHKPITTLRHTLTNVKDKEQPYDRQGAVYKINCADCQATYIGETGRNLNMRLTEHKRSTKTETKQTTLLNITDKPNTTSTGTRQSALLIAPTTYNALHSKVGIRTYNKTH